MLHTFAAIGLVLGSTLVSQAAETDDVQRWIAQLDNEKFAVREQATSDLISAHHQTALASVVRSAESGSPEAQARALHVLAMWHRSDKTSREAVTATTKRWQEAKNMHAVRLGNLLAAKTAPKPVPVTAQTITWAFAPVGVRFG